MMLVVSNFLVIFINLSNIKLALILNRLVTGQYNQCPDYFEGQEKITAQTG